MEKATFPFSYAMTWVVWTNLQVQGKLLLATAKIHVPLAATRTDAGYKVQTGSLNLQDNGWMECKRNGPTAATSVSRTIQMSRAASTKNASNNRTCRDGLMTDFGSMNQMRWNEAIHHVGMQGMSLKSCVRWLRYATSFHGMKRQHGWGNGSNSRAAGAESSGTCPTHPTVNDLSLLDAAKYIRCQVMGKALIVVQRPNEQAEEQSILEQGSN